MSDAEALAPARGTVRVALLDEQALLLDAMRAGLEALDPALRVVVTAIDWRELVRDPRFPVDVVVLAPRSGQTPSTSARIRACRAAGARVVVLSTGDDAAEGSETAAAVVRKSQPLAVLAAALRTAGGLDEPAAERRWRPLPEAPLRRPRLSLGEESALRLYAAGLTTPAVAAEMHVRFETAKTYLRRVREKYARVERPASRRAELVQRAREDGYLD